jgi:predicted dehydrogenase
MGLALVGAGGFAGFVADAARDVPGVSVVAVTDADAEAASRLARRCAALHLPDLAGVLADPDVEAVLIATPPSTHAEIAIRAARSGRHVFSEKPMALSARDAADIREAVTTHGVVYVVDHVLRYNPLVRALVRMREAGVLDAAQRFLFENDASDEHLGPDHWFWRPEVSGGILLEHGVHFLDVAELLIGRPARRVQAIGTSRPDGRVDTVVATIEHEGGALATHCHGFSHGDRAAERQLMRLDCGTGEVRLHGWIPLLAELDLWLDDTGVDTALTLLADPAALCGQEAGTTPAEQVVSVSYAVESAAGSASYLSRDHAHEAPHRLKIRIDAGWPEAKPSVYRRCVADALSDFVQAVRTGVEPQAGLHSGIASVRSAEAATRALRTGRTEPIPGGPQ